MKKLILALSLAVSFAVSAAGPFEAISSDEYGAKWAFNTDEVQLQCFYGGAFIFNYDNDKVYALTGLAKTLAKNGKVVAFPIDDSDLWKNDAQIPGAKMDLSPFINRALKLCDK